MLIGAGASISEAFLNSKKTISLIEPIFLSKNQITSPTLHKGGQKIKYQSIMNVLNNFITVLLSFCRDPQFMSIFHSLHENDITSPLEHIKQIKSVFPDFMEEATISPSLHSRHSRFSKNFTGVLFPLEPVYGQPTKERAIEICQRNLKRFTTLESIDNTFGSLKCIFQIDLNLHSWSKYGRLLKLILEFTPIKVCSLSNFITKYHNDRDILYQFEIDDIISSRVNKNLFISRVSQQMVLKKDIVKVCGVVAGVDELIYRWLSSSGSSTIFPWLGEFHLVFNIAKSSFLLIDSIPLGQYILSIMKITIDIKGIVKPSMSSSTMERTIDWILIFGQVIKLINENFISSAMLKVIQSSQQWKDLWLLSSLSIKLQAFLI